MKPEKKIARRQFVKNTAHLSSGLAHLGNIYYRLGRQLTFNPKAEKFINDPEADKMLTRNYRAPYVVPDKV